MFFNSCSMIMPPFPADFPFFILIIALLNSFTPTAHALSTKLYISLPGLVRTYIAECNDLEYSYHTFKFILIFLYFHWFFLLLINVQTLLLFSLRSLSIFWDILSTCCLFFFLHVDYILSLSPNIFSNSQLCISEFFHPSNAFFHLCLASWHSESNHAAW